MESATRVFKSVCRSCHGGCGALLHVRDGRLLKIEGDRDSALSPRRVRPLGAGTETWCEPGFAQSFPPRVNTCLLTFGDFPVCDYTGGTPPRCMLFWGHNP